MPCTAPYSDEECETFVENDEGLYDLWQASGLELEAWVRQHRSTVEAVMMAVESGVLRQHALKYGP